MLVCVCGRVHLLVFGSLLISPLFETYYSLLLFFWEQILLTFDAIYSRGWGVGVVVGGGYPYLRGYPKHSLLIVVANFKFHTLFLLMHQCVAIFVLAWSRK